MTALIAFAFLAAPAGAQHWTAVRLHTENMYVSQAQAVTGTEVGGWAFLDNIGYPIKWDLSTGEWKSLAVSGVTSGQVFAASNGQFGGWGGLTTGEAGIWTPDESAFVSLHPASNPYVSYVQGMDPAQQAGYVRRTVANPYNRAALWHGTAASYVDLHPSASIIESAATSCAANQQGGYYRVTGASGYHAALWSGAASSMLDLHPAAAIESQILGMAPGQQVGWSGAPGTHAALWRGSAASFIDMNPPGAGVSLLNATCGSAQVGWANIGVVSAGVWFGTPESFQPLHQYLPGGYRQSIATGVSVFNGTYYISGYANNNATGHDEAFVWIGVPTPGTVAAFSAAAAMSARRVRR